MKGLSKFSIQLVIPLATLTANGEKIEFFFVARFEDVRVDGEERRIAEKGFRLQILCRANHFVVNTYQMFN